MYCFELILEDEGYCYIDGSVKHIWPSSKMPKLFSYIMMNVKVSLAKTLLTPQTKDGPAIPLSTPPDTRLRKLMPNLIGAITKATGKKVIEAAVFNRQRLLLTIFMEFDRLQRYFLCPLKNEEYQGIKDFQINEDFKLLKKYEPDIDILPGLNGETGINELEWVADARFILINKERDITYPARVALLVVFGQQKINLTPIITNIPPEEEPDISKVALRYLNSRPSQQSIFLYLMEAIKADQKLANATLRFDEKTVARGKETGSKDQALETT